jgi:hypothetical protein
VSKLKFILFTSFLSLLMFASSSLLVSNVIDAKLLGTKWAIKNTSGAVVKVRNASLTSGYSNVFSTAYNKWNNSGASISISNTTSTTRGTINFQSQSQSTWSANGWGTGEAWAQPWNEDTGVICASNPFQDPSLKCSSVTGGLVYTNTGNQKSDSKRLAAVLAHEIGHIVGLAHPTGGYETSIMCSNLDCGYRGVIYDVKSYDIEDINRLY